MLVEYCPALTLGVLSGDGDLIVNTGFTLKV